MDFSDKLNFLFKLTHAEGKELAAAMNVTPPQISKMRSGVRGLPKNPEAARAIAVFFAQRCDSAAQKDSLAKAMRLAQVRNVQSEHALTDLLLKWFSNTPRVEDHAAKNADEFMLRLNATADVPAPVKTETHRVLQSSGNSIMAFYGNEGKRMAAITFLQYIAKLGKAYEISILSDESTLWILEKPDYSSSLYELMVRLTKQGCVFRRIVGPLSDVNQAFESLNRWFPLYMTGKATSYYYKRMRDNLSRITIFAVPDSAVMFSFSVGRASDSDAVTFFTSDPNTVSSMMTKFENYLAMCEPIMKVYSSDTSSKRMHECMLNYESAKALCLQTNNSLSFITLPWDIAVALQSGGKQEAKDLFLNSFAQRYKKFSANLEQYDFFDIIRLADPEDVIAGIVPIPASNIINDEVQYYSPLAYLQHLKSVLYLIEHRPHYHAVVRAANESDVAIVYVKEGNTAVLTRALTPFVIFEVSERNLVDAFTEYLRRMLPLEADQPKYRRTASASIRALISEIEKRMAAG